MSFSPKQFIAYILTIAFFEVQNSTELADIHHFFCIIISDKFFPRSTPTKEVYVDLRVGWETTKLSGLK